MYFIIFYKQNKAGNWKSLVFTVLILNVFSYHSRRLSGHSQLLGGGWMILDMIIMSTTQMRQYTKTQLSKNSEKGKYTKILQRTIMGI